MEKYNVYTKDGNIIITQIDSNNAMIWPPKSCANGFKLDSQDMEKLAKALFKMSKQLRGKNTDTKPMQPNNTPTIKQYFPKEENLSKMEITKSMHSKAYSPWTSEEEALLTQLHKEGKTNREIAHILNRNEGGIESRLNKLGLSD